jgi:hypothetical protein
MLPLAYGVQRGYGYILSRQRQGWMYLDNSLTGTILAWSAESEREKILEYANRHWQTRLENNLPVGTGRTPYGWDWKDKDATHHVINKEEAAVRISLFTMFVEEDMSLRRIAHKLTESFLLLQLNVSSKFRLPD